MQPWFKFYAADYLLDDAVFEMPPEAGQLLVMTWCLCWRDGCAPADPDKLARAARLDKRYVRRHVETILRFFRVEDGMLISARMERARAENEAKSEVATTLARNAANARWERERREKSGNRDAQRNADRNADRNASQSQSQSQSQKQTGDAPAPRRLTGSTSAPEPSKSTPRASGAHAPASGWQDLVDALCTSWSNTHSGARYAFTGRDGTKLKELRATLADDVILERWQRYLADRDTFIANNGASIALFASTSNRYADGPKASAGLDDDRRAAYERFAQDSTRSMVQP